MKNQFQKNAVVWARFNGPREMETWPARVMKYQVDPNKNYSYEVYFFNDKGATADIEPHNLFEYMRYKDEYGKGVDPKSKKGKAIVAAEAYFLKAAGDSQAKSQRSKSLKPTKQIAEDKDASDAKSAKQAKGQKEVKQTKSAKSPKDSKESKGSKESPPSKKTPSPKQQKRSASSKGKESRHVEPEVIEASEPVVELPAKVEKPAHSQEKSAHSKRERSKRESPANRNIQPAEVSESKKVESPRLVERAEPAASQKREAVSTLLKGIGKQLGGLDDQMVQRLINDTFLERQRSRDDQFRKHEQDWFDIIFEILETPQRSKEHANTISELLTEQQKNAFPKHPQFYSTRIYIYMKYLLKILEHLQELYSQSHDLLKDQVAFLRESYEDTTMSTRSLDVTFDTKFFQQPMGSAYQQLRKAGMLHLRLPNSLNTKFAFMARQILTREGIKLEDALAAVENYAKVHSKRIQNNSSLPPRELAERDIKQIVSFRA